MGASRLTAKSYTEEEIREIAERQNLVGYPLLVRVQAKSLGTAGGGQDSGGDKVGEETGL